MNFFPDFAPNSRKEWRVSLFQSNLRKQIRKLPKILKFVRIIHYYSKLFTGVLLLEALHLAHPGRVADDLLERRAAEAAEEKTKNAFLKNAFSKILQIFGGLVLGCIKTKFCKKICVWQHFASSTRFAYSMILLHRCNLKILAKKSVWKISNFCENSAKILQMSQNLQNFAKINFKNFSLIIW